MEKLRKLTQMTEHPEQYSDEEWQEIFDDETIDEEHVEEAWRTFEAKHLKPQATRLWRVAATFIGVLMLSGIALAAWIAYPKASPSPSEEENVETLDIAASANPTSSPLEGREEAIRVFEDAELQQIVDSLSLYYKVKPGFRHDAVSHLRLYYEWDQHHSLSRVVSELNHFDRVSIHLKGDSIIIE